MSKVFVIHENHAWVEPLREAFAVQGVPFEEWFVDGGALDLGAEPPHGVFYNRMSASSHTRNHRFAPEQTSVLLAWLERHGRRVINGSRALRLEISKAAQYAALNAQGVATPPTVAVAGDVFGNGALRSLGTTPIILKPNRGGKGQGVRRFETASELAVFVGGEEFEPSLDGISLVQQHVASPENYITRVEFIGGEYFYAVRVETEGSFELCPADPCAAVDRAGSGKRGREPRFTIGDAVDPDLIRDYRAFFAANGVEIGAAEFITDIEGRTYTYDVNTNTNYNSAAEADAGRFGMQEVARFLGQELARTA
jgi:hypothetical protein